MLPFGHWGIRILWRRWRAAEASWVRCQGGSQQEMTVCHVRQIKMSVNNPHVNEESSFRATRNFGRVQPGGVQRMLCISPVVVLLMAEWRYFICFLRSGVWGWLLTPLIPVSGGLDIPCSVADWLLFFSHSFPTFPNLCKHCAQELTTFLCLSCLETRLSTALVNSGIFLTDAELQSYCCFLRALRFFTHGKHEPEETCGWEDARAV